MASIAKLVVSMGLDSASLVTDIDRASRRSQASLRKFHRQVDRTGKLIGTALGAGLALSIREAIKFESAMSEVSTLLEDTSGIDALSDSVKRLSVEFGQAPTDQAKALYQIISAGASDAATQIELLTASNKLALGGVTDVKTAADGLTTVLNAYAGTGLTAADVSDSLFTTMKQGKTTIEELSSSIGNVATIAAQTGVSLAEIGAAVGTLTKSGIATGESMNALRGVLAAVLKQSEQSKKAAKDLGVEFSVAALQAKGLTGFLADIAESGATEEQLAKLFGRVEGLSAVMSLGANDAKEFTAQLEEQAKAAGATGDAVAKMADTTAFKIAQARSAIQVLSIEIGEGFLSAISSSATGAVENIDKIRKFIVQLVEAFKVLGAVATAVGAIIVSTFSSLFTLAKATVLPVIDLLTGSLEIAVNTASGNIAAALAAGEQTIERFNKRITDAGEALKTAGGFAAESVGGIKKALDDAAAALNEFDASLKGPVDDAGKLDKALDGLNKRVTAARKLVSDAADALDDAGKETVDFTKHVKTLAPELERIAGIWAEVEEGLDDLIAEQTRFERSIDSLLDAAFPVEALVRDYEQSVRDLNRAFEEGRISPEQYAVIITFLGDSLGEAAKQSQEATSQIASDADLMREAALEAVRQMTSAFLGMWKDILSGGKNAFDGLADSLENMLAQFQHSISTAKVGEEFQSFINDGTFDWKNFAKGAGAAVATAIGAELGGGGQAAQIGAALGSVIGSIWGPVGQAIGSLLGGLAGGLFDRDALTVIGGIEFPGASDIRQQIETDLGIVQGIHAQGGVGGFEEAGTAGAEIGQAIAEFDQAIHDLVLAASGTEQLDIIRDALKDWGGTWKEGAITIENILGSRFDAILSTFETDIQDFVGLAADLEGQISHLGVALTAAKVLEELPQEFDGRSLKEFLGVVKAFEAETGNLEDALTTVLGLIDQIIAAKTFLQDFSLSDLQSEFDAFLEAQNRSLGESLALVSSELTDAIMGFDGSVESINRIAELTASVREGEIRYLTQLDALQKGLNTTLDELRADVLGLTAPEPDTSAILGQAQGLIDAVSGATSAEEISDLGQQFNTLIRSISEDETKFRQVEILGIIDAFQAAANSALESLRAGALENADSLRELVDVFLTDIGDPLSIIAATNERAAAALEQIAGTFGEPDLVDVTPIEGASGMDFEEQERIMDDGLREISFAIRDGQSQNAQAIVNAIRNADFPVTVVINEGGFVGQ